MSNDILGEASTFVRRRNWFLGIGINDYVEFPKLHNAVKDVQDIEQLLLDEYDFDPDRVITLFNEEASIEGIIGALDALAEQLDKTDTLLIYYSGHGHLNSKELGFWIPYDAKRGNTARYIANSRLRDAIGSIDAQHVLLISDSCFSGSLLSKGASRSTRLIRELDSSPSRWALCSGRGDEEVADGVPGTNSPFATSVMTALRDPADSLNISKIVERVREQVASNSSQIPEGHPMQGVGHGWGEYIFRKKSAVADKPFTEGEEEAEKSKAIRTQIPVQTRGKSGVKKLGDNIYWIIGIAGGVIALVVVGMIFLRPSASGPMQLTVFVTDESGNVVLENKGTLNIPIGNRSMKETIGANGRTQFPDIAAEYKGDSIQVGLDAEGWQIADGKDRFVFDGKPIHLVVKKDEGLGLIKGIVKSEDGARFLEGANVLINNEHSVTTDAQGMFRFTMPSSEIADHYDLSVQKDGYERQSLFYYPASGSVEIRLGKKAE